jgi:hypothetical protein
VPSAFTSVSTPVPAGHQGVKKARPASTMPRRMRRPRVQAPGLSAPNSAAVMSASSRYAQSYIRSPWVPEPADGRRQCAGPSVAAISAAVPATARSVRHDQK